MDGSIEVNVRSTLFSFVGKAGPLQSLEQLDVGYLTLVVCNIVFSNIVKFLRSQKFHIP